MNIKGSTRTYDNVPGDELIPAGYQQLELPTYLDSVRTRLFGAMPDRAMLNYRVRQLLTLIEATELQSHILNLDPRLTYSSQQNDLISELDFRPVVTQYQGTEDNRITITGNAISPDTSGLSGYDYRVVTDGSNINIERLNPPPQSKTELLNMTDGLSQPVSLPLSGYRVSVSEASPAAWTIRGYLRPTESLINLDQRLRSIGEPYLLQLFGTSNVEPYVTFRNCWVNHPEFAYRLGGIVLAAIYRTEEIRNAQ